MKWGGSGVAGLGVGRMRSWTTSVVLGAVQLCLSSYWGQHSYGGEKEEGRVVVH